MEKPVSSLQEQALKRKERLKALRDRQFQVSCVINVIFCKTWSKKSALGGKLALVSMLAKQSSISLCFMSNLALLVIKKINSDKLGNFDVFPPVL